jgi:hypothetical protein
VLFRSVAFLVAAQQTSLDQEPQVTRNARLALIEDFDQLGHGQLRMGAEAEYAKPGRLARRPQSLQKLIHVHPPIGKRI